MSARKGALALVVLVFATAACGSGRGTESKAVIPRDPGKLDGTHWILVATHDSDPVPASTPFSIQFDQSTASGAGPCNRYHLSFRVDGQDVATGPVIATKIACAQPLLSAEQRYFAALERVDTAQQQGTENQLVLSGPHDTRLAYVEADEPAKQLTGTWDITSYATPTAVTTPIHGTSPTMEFKSDGSVTIASGCNTAGTTWHADGTSLTFDPAPATLIACEKPAGLSEQETQMLAALPRVASVELGHDHATLLAKDGTIMFVLAPHS